MCDLAQSEGQKRRPVAGGCENAGAAPNTHPPTYKCEVGFLAVTLRPLVDKVESSLLHVNEQLVTFAGSAIELECHKLDLTLDAVSA